MGNAVEKICGRLAVGLRGLIPAPLLVSATTLVGQSCRLLILTGPRLVEFKQGADLKQYTVLTRQKPLTGAGSTQLITAITPLQTELGSTGPMLMLLHRQKDRVKKAGEGQMLCEKALRWQVFCVFIFPHLQTTLVLGTSKEMKKLIKIFPSSSMSVKFHQASNIFKYSCQCWYQEEMVYLALKLGHQ